jgi:putative membrane protein
VKFLIRLVVNAIALWLTVKIVPDLKWVDEKDLVSIVVLALIFGVINSYLKPILKLLSLPLRLITLGLFGLVINTALFLLLAWVGDQLGVGFTIAGWPAAAFSAGVVVTAFIGALVLSIVSSILAFVAPD